MNAVSHDQAHAALWDAIKRLITDCDGTPNISAGAPGVSDRKARQALSNRARTRRVFQAGGEAVGRGRTARRRCRLDADPAA